ncbi:MAG TPA: transglutaminase family protein [Amaricoccus sp.]|uniref:transglutaminase family protein n=1 Tax=Amaricoccus sp. TaxID=1872485 RepID=UPI002B752C40|nr:transglutaminase family protein [Amaricoccus sp.]HMQ94463.1 transglutaminase family protein [Amaricoccus sp.]HMR51142.1 transglutaminase family protein [Amaricoccus sp.]HMR59186.1 transglutaminase family protein [Amaricoccus sp.]HMT98110.1 transglutaminase family protein [Amaricoccus sp.]
MIYDIGLTIGYRYQRAAVAGRHLLRLMPADLPGQQRRLSGSLAIAPTPFERRDVLDFFGNAAVEIAFREAHDEIAFRVAARIERLAQASVFDISPGLYRLADEIAGYRGLDPEAPHHFVGPSPRIPASREMAAYAAERAAPGMTVREVIRAVGLGLHADLAYDPQATNVETTPAEAFARRHGVCQDFAQIMIACLRGIGVPAAYVSGFLRTEPPPGEPRLEGADAMHAWVRAWCGWEAGWVEFDPTNAVFVAADHVVIARGRDYGDVSPVRGVLRTAGSQTSEQSVDVVPVGI